MTENKIDYERRKRGQILAEAYHFIGYTHARFEKYRDARSAYLKSLRYRREAGLPSGWAATLNDISFVHSEIGELKRARRSCEHGLEMREKIGHEYFIGLSRNTLGLIYLKENQLSGAQEHCEAALKLFEEQNDKRGIGLACNALGQIFRRLGASTEDLGEAEKAFQQGKEYLERSIDIFTEREETPRLMEAHNELGCLYRDWGAVLSEKGRKEEAREFFRKAEKNIGEAIKLTPKGMIINRVDFLEDLAEVYMRSGAFKEMDAVLTELDRIIPGDYKILSGKKISYIHEPVIGFWTALGKSHLLQAQIAYARDDHKEAAKHCVIAGAYFEHRHLEDVTALEHTTALVYNAFAKLPYKALREARDYALNILSEYKIEKYEKMLEAIEDALGMPERD